ncbi:MAG: hypothetical protein Q8J69_10250 [Sphingobacteriaceae bacterium]|nr:hypothetical protein [Sphingobacteriaceae bacterium]
MKSRGIQFLLLVVISLIVACSGLEPAEYETIDQKLFVKEFGSGVPIENATITLYQNRTTKYDGYPDGKLVSFASHRTDSTGLVHLQGRMQKISLMAVNVPTPKRYFDVVVFGEGWGRTDHNAVATLSDAFIANPVFELYPHAWLKLYFGQFEGVYDEVRFASNQRLNGKILKSGTTGAWLTKGNTWHVLSFDGFKGGRRIKSWEQEVYIPGHDTTTHQVDAYLIPNR